MKSFKRFIYITFFLFTISGCYFLSIKDIFFDRFTSDVNGFLAIMQFVLPAFVFVYGYETLRASKRVDLDNKFFKDFTFVICVVFLIAINLLIFFLVNFFSTNKIELFIPENLFVSWFGYIFLHLAFNKHNSYVFIPLIRLEEKPFYYLKALLIPFVIAFALLFALVSTTASEFQNEKTDSFRLVLDCFTFLIIISIISFTVSYGINRVSYFRKSILFPLILTLFVSFWIFKSIGFFHDYFRVFMEEDRMLLMIISMLSFQIVTIPIDRSLNNFKINKLTSDFSKKEAEYLQLKQQVNPHFLFNNLNTLISFIEINPKKAIEFGHHLSNTYRHYLNNKNDDFVSLKEELVFIKEYLEIYKAKFENSFSFEIAFEPKENEYIVCLSLQEIVDNVFKHNTMDENKPLEIKISRLENGLVIENTVTNKMESESNQIGLENINKRYEILTNKEIQIVNNTDSYQVILPILELEN